MAPSTPLAFGSSVFLLVPAGIRDRGGGIPAEQLDELLRPFVTPKPTGTGLGLVVATRAMEQHRARFQLQRRQGGGTVAAIRFPVRRAAGPPAPAREVVA